MANEDRPASLRNRLPNFAIGAFLLALLLGLSPATSFCFEFDRSLPGGSGGEIVHSRDRIPCGRDSVAVDIYEPAEEGSYPAVILLHGSHGPGRAECYYIQQAEGLARHGYVSLFVRYYDRGRRGRGNRQEWSETIAKALTFATNMRKVDDSRLALVGYSQGAFLALNAAPLDERVRAVVAFYGGLSPGFKGPAGRAMPPTLIFHGTSDRVVPVRRALETLNWLRSNNQPADLVLYRGATHGFNLSSRGGVDERATEDSWQRTLSFLDFHLRYPAWTPAPLPLATGDDGDGPADLQFFEQDPFETLPYLTGSSGDGDSDGFALINPDPSDSSLYVTPPGRRGGSHSPSFSKWRGKKTHSRSVSRGKVHKPNSNAVSKGKAGRSRAHSVSKGKGHKSDSHAISRGKSHKASPRSMSRGTGPAGRSGSVSKGKSRKTGARSVSNGKGAKAPGAKRAGTAKHKHRH